MLSVDVSRGRLPARWLFVRVLGLLVALVAVSGNSFAGQVKLAWDPVAQATGYRVHYGTSSGSYASSVDAQNQTNVTVPGLTDGVRYYFAVKAYNGTTTSNFSTQVSAIVQPQPSAPVASFSASPTTGVAPLVVSLTDTSGGSITSRSWNLGDGTAAATQVVAKTYSNPGTYTVTLTVTGSGGSATASKSISVAAAPVTPAPTPRQRRRQRRRRPRVPAPAAPRRPPLPLIRGAWWRPTALRNQVVARLLTHQETRTRERSPAPHALRRTTSDEP